MLSGQNHTNYNGHDKITSYSTLLIATEEMEKQDRNDRKMSIQQNQVNNIQTPAQHQGKRKGQQKQQQQPHKDDVNLLLRKERKFLRPVVIGVAKWGIKRQLVLRLIHPKISKENRSITNGKM